MKHLWTVVLALGFAATSIAAPAPEETKPKREVMPIGGQWNLSGTKLDRAKTDGKRVVQLVARGDAKLKRGRNALLGPWVLEVSAEVIEADFPGKKFVVRGPYTILQKGKAGSIETSGPGPDSSAEFDFRDGAIRSQGPSQTKIIDADSGKPGKKAAE